MSKGKTYPVIHSMMAQKDTLMRVLFRFGLRCGFKIQPRLTCYSNWRTRGNTFYEQLVL